MAESTIVFRHPINTKRIVKALNVFQNKTTKVDILEQMVDLQNFMFDQIIADLKKYNAISEVQTVAGTFVELKKDPFSSH